MAKLLRSYSFSKLPFVDRYTIAMHWKRKNPIPEQQKPVQFYYTVLSKANPEIVSINTSFYFHADSIIALRMVLHQKLNEHQNKKQ